MSEDHDLPKSPSSPQIELAEDFDQYEHPYNYDNELPDDAEIQEDVQRFVDEEYGGTKE